MIRQFPQILAVLFLLIFSQQSFTQQKKNLAVEDIWAKGQLWPQYIPGFNWYNDDSYTSLMGNKIFLLDALNGEVKETIFNNEQNLEVDDYKFSDDKKKILIETESEQIYRYSSRAIFYIYDIASRTLRKISDTKISYPTVSPDGEKIAYVTGNNLYYAQIDNLSPIQVTVDGKVNEIINGSTDWVYEEEFVITKAFDWSSDSKKIAFLKFNESAVKEYHLQYWDGLYPRDYKYKYPKAGEKNSIVSLHCYFLTDKKITSINCWNNEDTYIPRLTFTKNADLLSVQTLNRYQNHFQIFHIDVVKGDQKKVYEEKNYNYVDITDDLTYLNDGLHFIITSEKDGYKHIYSYDMNGKEAAKLTFGNWEVTKLAGVDEKNKLVYFTSTEVSPLERHVYSVNLTGKKKTKLTTTTGTHDAEFSPGFKYFINTFSTLNEPPRFSMHLSKSGKEVKVLEENNRLKKTMETFSLNRAEFFNFKTKDNVQLNGFMIKPLNMDPNKKYPVLLSVYGGPGHQSVMDSWMGPNYFWFQMLAQQGYIIVSIDNRGTGGRGADFKKITQNVLGKYETEDVINTAIHLKTLDFVDGSRIGIFGWSFGGYLASLAITLGADHFKTAIAVAPVTSWRFYDTIYTERYLGLPGENAEGYDKYSPLSYADKLKGNYLLIHGTADDNVHVQNALEMQDALIKANKQFEVFYYPDRNHGIYGGTTRLHLYKLMTDFIQRKL